MRGSTGGGGGGQCAYNEIWFTESTCHELEGTVAEYFDWCAVRSPFPYLRTELSKADLSGGASRYVKRL